MMIRKVFEKLAAIALTATLALLTPITAVAGGLGVAPSQFEITDALRGGVYDKTVTIFNSNPVDVEFTFYAEGGIAEWISFHELDDSWRTIKSVFIPANEKLTIIARFEIPADAASQTYNCAIYVQSAPAEDAEQTEQGSSISLKMPVFAKVTVTGLQRLEGTVTGIFARDTTIGQILPVEVSFDNTGNVAATPRIIIKFKYGEKLVDEIEYNDTSIGVNKFEVITINWDTSGLREGDYNAQVTVSLAGNVLSEKEISFTLLSGETVASGSGELTGFEYTGQPAINTITKIMGTFLNSADTEVSAKLLVEVYQNESLIEVLESEEVLFIAGEENTLDVYFTPAAESEYALKGHVNYGGRKTDTRELVLTIGEPGNNTNGNSTALIIIIVTTAVIIGAVVLYFMSSKRGSRS